MNYNQGMSHSLNRRVLTAWIAALAILFGALAPSISHALSAGRGEAVLSAICSASGIRMSPVFADDAGRKPVKDGQHPMEHCPYCATHGANAALLPNAPITFAVLGG